MVKNFFWLLCIICFGATALPANADDTEGKPGSIEKLLGDWQGDCDAWGTPAKCEISWQNGLHTDHYTITYEIKTADSGKTIFAGHGTYRNQTDQLDGYWADSSGDVHRLNAKWKESALETHWGIAGEKQGRTSYVLHPDGSLTVTDALLQSSGWSEFMRVDYNKY